MKKGSSIETEVIDEVPAKIEENEILHHIYAKAITWKHIYTIKYLTTFNDEIIAAWLNISVRTFREYKKPKSIFKENTKEQVFLLLTLFKHGKSVFGSTQHFDQWLNTNNFFFDYKKPASFLNTVTGIKFVDARLTAMEYGDNV